MEDYLDTPTAAGRVGVSVETLLRAVRRKDLRAYQRKDGRGKGWRLYVFMLDDLDRFKQDREALHQV